MTTTACPSTGLHGDLNSYTHHGCRCPDATAANARSNKRHAWRTARLGHGLHVDPTGTARRLRALVAIGYNTRDLAREVGSGQQRIRAWIHMEHASVHHDTATRVRGAYRRLADSPNRGPQSVKTLRWAESNGWLPPICWDDDTIDDPDPFVEAVARTAIPLPAVAPALTVANQRTAADARRGQVAVLHAAHLSDREIAARLGCQIKRVRMDRYALGLGANYDHTGQPVRRVAS